MDQNNNEIDLVLEAIKDMYVFSRRIFDIDSGEIKMSTLKLEFTKLNDENLSIKPVFDNEPSNSVYSIPTNLLIEAITNSTDTGMSLSVSQNAFNKAIDEHIINAFEKKYGNNHTTLLSIFKKSAIVILDKDKKPSFAFDNNKYIFDFNDIFFGFDKNIDSVTPDIIVDSTKFYLDFTYTLCDQYELFLDNNNKIYLNFYNAKYPDRVFCFELKQQISNKWSIESVEIIKESKIVSVYKENVDNLPTLLMLLSNQNRKKKINILSLID